MFWKRIASLILNNRLLWLGIIAVITALMGFMASRLELSYELAKILPESDPSFKRYEAFKQRYGEDGNVMIVAIETDKMYQLDFFNGWYDLAKRVKGISGVKNVASTTNLVKVVRNETEKKFETQPIVAAKPTTQAEVDTIKATIERYPFYKGFVYSNDGKAFLMAITFNQADLNSARRISIAKEVEAIANEFGQQHQVDVHFSGMPYIRTNFMSKVRDELIMFMGLAFLVTTFILYLFFRSVRVVFFAVLVVLIAVVWSVGIIDIFGYKITILTGMIPPLIMVIGIPNTIFLINKYQEEYIKTGNQRESLLTSIEKIGRTTFIANLTTFIGFFVFYFTGSPFLVEFGMVAALAVTCTWAISLILIPIIFSYNAPPKAKHVQHLENARISRFLEWVNFVVHNRRTRLYWAIAGIIAISVYGMTRIKAVGYVVDDLPKSDPIYTDLKFIEKHFNGVVPFEVEVDTKRENGVLDPVVLNQIRQVQRAFEQHPEFTKPISIVEGIKFIYQGYRGGDPRYYQLPGALELQKLGEYQGTMTGKENQFASFLDSTRRHTRISFQAADAGTNRMKVLIDELQAKVDTIFNYDKETGEWLPEEMQTDAKLTGNGVVFTQGNNYLLRNLRDSTILAIVLVCIVMATQFPNYRMIMISAIPSIIPLIITAGIMGYFGVPLKPSTTLIFSIAFGIASDGTIYFLTKYREELRKGKSIGESVTETIRYTGISMFYTAIILFFGFGIFVASGFKGTVFLGLLVSVTLLMGMVSNLILLPAFLMTLDKRQTAKQHK